LAYSQTPFRAALQAARKAPNANLFKVSELPARPELAGHLGLEDHSDADTLAVQHTGHQHGFNHVSDRVSKVDEVAQPGRLALVVGDDMRLDGD
jgi:hypothetical protein